MNNNDQKQAKHWAALLLECTKETPNMKDAFGVIVACKLWDLEQKGLIENHDGPGLLNIVNENSNEGTQKWLAKEAISAEDPVKRLHFNYH